MLFVGDYDTKLPEPDIRLNDGMGSHQHIDLSPLQFVQNPCSFLSAGSAAEKLHMKAQRLQIPSQRRQVLFGQ